MAASMPAPPAPAPAAASAFRTWRPPLGAVARQRIGLELRSFVRVREEVVFTFALPIVLLGLFATIFGGEMGTTGVEFSQYYVAGMLAATGLTVGFQSLSGQLALEQHDGTLKRLAGTPMPRAAYMIGKVGMVCAVAVVQTVLLFSIGIVLFGVTLPDAEGWMLLGSVLALNLAVWTLLGLAFSRVIGNPRAGAAVAAPPVLVLQFISGVYIPFDSIPGWLQNIASVFPLRWAALGMRQALLPDSFAAVEPPDGSWQTPLMYGTLVGWLVLASVLATVFFRWRVRE